MANLYLSLSPPCYDTQQLYTERKVPINRVFDSGDCPGDIGGIRTHQGYIATGLIETERDMLAENGILEGVASKIPSYDAS